MKLLRLDARTIINPDKIVEITIRNLDRVRRERRQYHETPEQRERMRGMYWEVSVYLRSDSDGYNPQRYTRRFPTRAAAQGWIEKVFGSVVVNDL
jgi:hypothetical protein